jgi:hypothetical protein
MNRTVILLIVLLVFSAAVNAQFTKGMRTIGATVGTAFFNGGKTDISYPPPTAGYTSNNDNYGISLSPEMGWFVSDNMVAGARLIFAYSKSKTNDVSDASGNTFNKDESDRFNAGIGGFLRNYFKSPGSVSPFGQFNLSLGTGSSSTKGFTFNGNDKSSYDGNSSGDFFINAGISLGITKMLNDHTGLDFFAGYTYSRNKSTFSKTTNVDQGNNGTIDITFENNPTQKFSNNGLSLGISLQVFLDKKKK